MLMQSVSGVPHKPVSSDAAVAGALHARFPAMGLSGLHVTPRTVGVGEPRLPRHFLTHNARREASGSLVVDGGGKVTTKDKSKDVECANIAEYETGCERLARANDSQPGGQGLPCHTG